MVVREPNAAEPGATKTMASAVEDRAAAKPAAMEYGAAGSQAATMKYRTAAAVERCGPTMKSAATVKSATAVEASAAAMKAAATSATVETTTTTTASAMSTTTADFGRQSAGDGFRRRGRARIDQRQRLRALWNG